jgi:hypothetical protein
LESILLQQFNQLYEKIKSDGEDASAEEIHRLGVAGEFLRVSPVSEYESRVANSSKPREFLIA